MQSFQLTVTFASLAALTAFVNKMGSDLQGAEIGHTQALTPDSVPAAPAVPAAGKPATSRSRGKKTDVDVPAAPAAPAAPLPFPGGAGPASFAPGNIPAPAAPSSVPAPAAPAQPAPVNAPVVPPPPAPAAPATPAAPAVSPERQQWNSACGQLIQSMEAWGPAWLPHATATIQNSFQEIGLSKESSISGMSDAHIQQFYPILHKNVSALAQQYDAWKAQSGQP